MSSEADAARVRMLFVACRVELRRQGAKPGEVDRLLRLIDLDRLEEADGELAGLSEQVAEIKADFPGRFVAEQPVRRARKTEQGAEGDEQEAEPRSATERQAEALRLGEEPLRSVLGPVSRSTARTAAALLRSAGEAERADRLERAYGGTDGPEAA